MNQYLHQAQSHEVLRSWQSRRTDMSHHKDFVLPMFICTDDDAMEPIESMPDVYRYGCNRAMEYLEPLVLIFGLRAILLFPVIDKAYHSTIKSHITLVNGGHCDDDDQSTVSVSSDSSQTSSQSSSTESLSTSVLPERLLPVADPSAVDQASSGTTSQGCSQNPFLNENEEEEDHLLGEANEPGAGRSEAPTREAIPTLVDEQSLARELVRSKTLDTRLIKTLAFRGKHNPVLRLLPKLRAKFPELLIMCDVCLCAFTSTGHCCLFNAHPRSSRHVNLDFHNHLAQATGAPSVPLGRNSSSFDDFLIDNKKSCQYLAQLSVEYALRGCHVVAPSDMMDGRVLAIREQLDKNRLHHVSILSYSAKFASTFYGPFRQAANSAPAFGDRRAYQLPPGSRSLALRSVQRDIEQGADFVMVKPGGPYLDVVRDIREAHPNIPIAVYQVSGEYSMLKMAAMANVVDLKSAVNEFLTSFRRAGATIIISYFTPQILRGEL